jgi:putative transposase
MAIFSDDFDRIYMLDLFSRATVRFKWRCLAYCLMGNHYHLLVRLADANLSEGMRFIQTRYARRFNSRRNSRGHVFGDRFHDRRVDGDGHLLAAAVYTVQNPVRAGIVSRPEEWLWSSYRATAGLEDVPSLLDAEFVLGLLSPDPERSRAPYRDLVAQSWRRADASMKPVTVTYGDSHPRQ